MLLELLSEFKNKVNSNPKIVPLTKKWEPNIIINVLEREEYYTLKIRNSKVAEILPVVENNDHEVHLEGEEEDLAAIFSGKNNPVQAVLDGSLEIFGEQSDQIKLDIIAMVIWG